MQGKRARSKSICSSSTWGCYRLRKEQSNVYSTRVRFNRRNFIHEGRKEEYDLDVVHPASYVTPRCASRIYTPLKTASLWIYPFEDKSSYASKSEYVASKDQRVVLGIQKTDGCCLAQQSRIRLRSAKCRSANMHVYTERSPTERP